MLSTLKCIFEGRRELFKGLKIEKMRWDWAKTYPVVMLNMADVTASTVAAEEGSAFGYADAIIETKKFVWVFEFKFNKSTSRSDAKHPFPRNSVPFAPASPGGRNVDSLRRVQPF